MSSEWEYAPLAEVCSRITYGFTNPMPTIDGEGAYMVTAKDIKNGRIQYQTARKTSWDAYRDKLTDKSRPSKGDLLLTKDGSIGRLALCDRDDICINQSVALLQSNGKGDFRYIKYLLEAPEYQRKMESDSDGSTIKHIYITRVDKMMIPLPPRKEQEGIVSILGTLDDKIELNRKTNETLEAMAKALFKSWFVDFDPVKAKVEGRPTGLPAEISDLFPDSFEDSELGEIPIGWRVAPVGDFVECVGGSTPSTNEPEYWDGGEYFWATPKDLSSLSDPFLLDTAKKITADGVQRISSGILPVGTVLLSSRAPVGYVAAACVPVSINQGFIAIKSNDLMSSAYLLNWCLSNVQQFKDRASGTTFAEISKAAFRPIPLLVPSEQVARSFSDKAQALYERVVSNMRQSMLLATTRDALLPKLISGEIRIPDPEKLLESVR
jgi:type I restriction enzyme S subunit